LLFSEFSSFSRKDISFFSGMGRGSSLTVTGFDDVVGWIFLPGLQAMRKLKAKMPFQVLKVDIAQSKGKSL
jgi:hypothetical protein